MAANLAYFVVRIHKFSTDAALFKTLTVSTEVRTNYIC